MIFLTEHALIKCDTVMNGKLWHLNCLDFIIAPSYDNIIDKYSLQYSLSL